MSNEEYIQMYPHQFKDELDRWLFRELSISGGACSAQRSMEYSVARMVGDKLLAAIENYVDQGNSDWTEEFMDGLKKHLEK